MGLPSVNAVSGDDQLYFLDGVDVALLRAVIDRERMRIERSGTNESQEPYYDAAPDVYFAKIPATHIPARVDVTLGKAECEIYKTPLTAPLDQASARKLESIFLPDGTSLKRTVYNLYPVKWYGVAGEDAVDQFIVIQREKSGIWICEKPPYYRKCKAIATIPAGDTEPSANNTAIYINGTGVEDIKAYNDWMNNGIQISSGKEGGVRYFEDQKHWSWVDAECEDA